MTVGGIFTGRKNDAYALATVNDLSQEKEVILSSSFVPGEKIGILVKYRQDRSGWRLVRLDSSSLRPNIIQVPQGFGQEVTLTEYGNAVSNSKVWIVNARCGVLVGHVTFPTDRRLALPIQQSGEDASEYLWSLQLPNKLSKIHSK